MNIQVTCRGLEHTEELEQHVRKQLERVVDFLGKDREPFKVAIVLTTHPDHAHQEAHLHVTSASYDVHVHREGPRLFPVIDEVIDIAQRELHNQKREHVDKRDHGGPTRPG